MWFKSDFGWWFNVELMAKFCRFDTMLRVEDLHDETRWFEHISNPTQLSRFCEWLVQTGMSQAEAEQAVGLAPAMVAETARLSAEVQGDAGLYYCVVCEQLTARGPGGKCLRHTTEEGVR